MLEQKLVEVRCQANERKHVTKEEIQSTSTVAFVSDGVKKGDGKLRNTAVLSPSKTVQ